MILDWEPSSKIGLDDCHVNVGLGMMVSENERLAEIGWVPGTPDQKNGIEKSSFRRDGGYGCTLILGRDLLISPLHCFMSFAYAAVLIEVVVHTVFSNECNPIEMVISRKFLTGKM